MDSNVGRPRSRAMPVGSTVDHQTLRHTRFENVFSLGDVCSAPNSKTAAAARKQAPIVAENVLAVLDSKEPHAAERAAFTSLNSCDRSPREKFARDSALEGGVSCELVSENAQIPC